MSVSAGGAAQAHPEVRRAVAAAVTVARDCGLAVRTLSDPAEFRAAADLLSLVWGADAGAPPIAAELMRAVEHGGGYVSGAYAADELVGVSVGFLARSEGAATPELHSHITGVVPHARGRQVGFALKLHQRGWALERGIDAIGWTFDPLVRRNAYFNLTKLGARVDSYLVDFYGDMSDGINVGQGSDRLLLSWPLRAAHVEAAANGRPQELDMAGDVLLEADPRDFPRRHSRPRSDVLLCAVPRDIEDVRRRDPALARGWRLEMRAALTAALADGGRVVGMRRPGWYVIATDEARRRPAEGERG